MWYESTTYRPPHRARRQSGPTKKGSAIHARAHASRAGERILSPLRIRNPGPLLLPRTMAVSASPGRPLEDAPFQTLRRSDQVTARRAHRHQQSPRTRLMESPGALHAIYQRANRRTTDQNAAPLTTVKYTQKLLSK